MLTLTSLLASASSQPLGGSGRAFVVNLAYLAAAACFIFGLKQLSHPRTARRGNLLASFGMLVAVIATLTDPTVMRGGGLGFGTIAAGLLLGCGLGAFQALRVSMKGMPQTISLFNGFGGLAAGTVGFGEFVREVAPAADVRFSVALSLSIGLITLTGSLVAWAKLEELKFKVLGMPLSGVVMLPSHRVINLAVGGAMLVLMVVLIGSEHAVWAAVLILLLAAAYGFIAVLPIGGADMPVVIALLNSLSGLGAAATGFVLHNNALIIGGSLVGASGFILTTIMCKAMNRSILNVLAGGFGTAPSDAGGATGAAAKPAGSVRRMDAEEAAMVLEAAQSVIIVPGYGMAVAQAQHAVAELMRTLLLKGATVRFAVHPVAGRMPGHMNVLLAEANVPYELLADLDINPEFEQCDVALVIGANDVVNPAARTDKASPIYGMPIFDVDKAKTVMVSKRSLNTGFAGIENELFYLPNTVMLFGDAKQMVQGIVTQLKSG